MNDIEQIKDSLETLIKYLNESLTHYQEYSNDDTKIMDLKSSITVAVNELERLSDDRLF